MKNRIVDGYLLLLVTSLACTDETTIFEDTLRDHIILETGEDVLQASIFYQIRAAQHF